MDSIDSTNGESVTFTPEFAKRWCALDEQHIAQLTERRKKLLTEAKELENKIENLQEQKNVNIREKSKEIDMIEMETKLKCQQIQIFIDDIEKECECVSEELREYQSYANRDPRMLSLFDSSVVDYRAYKSVDERNKVYWKMFDDWFINEIYQAINDVQIGDLFFSGNTRNYQLSKVRYVITRFLSTKSAIKNGDELKKHLSPGMLVNFKFSDYGRWELSIIVGVECNQFTVTYLQENIYRKPETISYDAAISKNQIANSTTTDPVVYPMPTNPIFVAGSDGGLLGIPTRDIVKHYKRAMTFVPLSALMRRFHMSECDIKEMALRFWEGFF